MADQKQDDLPVKGEVPDNNSDASNGNDEGWSQACSQSRETGSDNGEEVPLAAESGTAQSGTRSNTTEDTVETGSGMPLLPLHPTVLELDDEGAVAAEENDNEQSNNPSGA